MRLSVQWNPLANKWLLSALVLLALFLIYTAVYATGVLDVSTLQAELFLMHRPLTPVDCMFYEWRNFGEIPFTLAFLVILSIFCFLARYRWQAIPLLFLLFAFGTGAELVGKAVFNQPLSFNIRAGMTTLTCPQLEGQSSTSLKIAAALGLWWKIPAASEAIKNKKDEVAQGPVTFDAGSNENGYPGGHATRSAFIGLLVAWLASRHIKPRSIRLPVVVVASTLAFLGGFMQFYIGSHFITDTISGYLLGSSMACCAIGFLLLNPGRRKPTQQPASFPHDDWSNEETLELSQGGRSWS
ncbi:MAG TPA: phosphatase PAP2 family protein [Ktedonosporobacter sp.]|nr:phosphatase PAP2 family protein [Ktedonosporobacter sp.]